MVIKMKITTDLLVAGGGISGMCASIAAARLGLRVVLVNDRSVIGGNASSEIGVKITGASHGSLNAAVYAKETGIIEEIKLRLNYYKHFGGYGDHALLDAVFFDMIYNEENITLIMNTVVCGAETENGKITKVYAKHSVNSGMYEITADAYVDATGNGALGFEAGAEHKIGREGKNEYNEYWAPEEADRCTMGNSIYFEVADAGKPVPFKAPEFAHDISKMEFMKYIDKPENFREISDSGPSWTYEYGGHLDILGDHDETEHELRRLIYGIWDYVKNSGKYPNAKNRYLKRVFAKAGVRESRRFVGDYMLCENDIEQKKDYADSVSIGGWPMDIHAPKGIYDTIPATNFVPVTGTYNIPFRCLYSKNIDNLMMAGRDISATHIALGSTRVMATCGAMGQAVGTAAYLIKKYGETPRGIYERHIDELRKILVDNDQSILHYTQEVQDFRVEASSVKEYENVNFSEYMPLCRDYALAISPVGGKVETMKFRIKSEKGAELKYKILTGTHPETYLPEKVEKVMTRTIEPKTSAWVEIAIDSEAGEDGKLFIVFEKNEDIMLGIGKERPVGAVTYRMHTEQSHDRKNHDSIPVAKETGYTYIDQIFERERNILFRDIQPKQTVYAPENVLNGYLRPYRNPNLWIADGTGDETLYLYPNSDMKGMTIAFDSNLDVDDYNIMPKSLARDFTVRVYHRDGVCEFSEKENCKRFVKYDAEFYGVEKIEITVNETYGGNVGIYSVRIMK